MSSPNPRRLAPAQSQGQQPSETPFNARDAALIGATQAFAKPAVKPKPSLISRQSTNGALAAATSAERSHSPQRSSGGPSPGDITGSLSRQNTGSSYRSNRSSTHLSPYPPPNATLSVPSSSPNTRAMSPSNIAATLAAARYTPSPAKSQTDVSPRSHGAATPSRSDRNVVKTRGADGSSDHDGRVERTGRPSSPRPVMSRDLETTDDTSIPPTSALVRMFEANKQSTNEPRPAAKPIKSPISSPPILSPKPRRTLSTKLAVEDEAISQSGRNGYEEEPKKKPVAPKPKPKSIALPKTRDASGERRSPIPSPTPKSRPQTRGSIVSARGEISSPSSYTSAPESVQEPKDKPSLPPPRRTKKAADSSDPSGPSRSAAATPTKPQATKAKPAPPATLATRLSVDSEPYARPTSTPASSNYQQRSLAMINPHMTGDSLANAMVGAALASTRSPNTASPANTTAPPPLPSRSSYRRDRHHHIPFYPSRTPSPGKRPGKLRTTMREEHSSSSSSDEMHKKAKKFFGKKHPNKHHEGTRKRWRDSVTERERKRYEGVWAANRGLFLPRAQDEVLGIVVKDIWSRSRLPPVVLEEVWELVDTNRSGTLGREEFVVGLWLIDQSLKGRKLPIKVGESVWASVRGVGGIKINVKR